MRLIRQNYALGIQHKCAKQPKSMCLSPTDILLKRTAKNKRKGLRDGTIVRLETEGLPALRSWWVLHRSAS